MTRPALLLPWVVTACSGDQPAEQEPCELGMAVTADGGAHATLAAAVAAAVGLDGTIDVCAGEHEVDGYFDPSVKGNTSGTVTIRGAGIDRTSLVFVGEHAGGGYAADPILMSDLSIHRSATAWRLDACTNPGESDTECDSPFDRDGRPEGALEIAGAWAFDRVQIGDNEGYWGGALTVTHPLEGNRSEIKFTDCELVNNSALDSSGGAILVDYNDAWGPRGELTITSINTDWGTGDDDNTPDDIAFASWDGYFHDSLVVHASYQFDGVADFTCDALAYICE